MTNMQQAIDHIKGLSIDERALLAHCLISSLNNIQEEGVEESWIQLAEKRWAQLESGVVQAVSWAEIKKGIIK